VRRLLEALKIPISGPDSRRVRLQLDAIAAACFTLSGTRDGIDYTDRANVASRNVAWVGDDRGWLTLSAEFFEVVMESGVPLDADAIVRLRALPLALDAYAWLVHRLPRAKSKGDEISWLSLENQFGAGDFKGKYADSEWKRALREAIRKACGVYPGARVDILPWGLRLLPSATAVPPSSIPAVNYCPHEGDGRELLPTDARIIAHGDRELLPTSPVVELPIKKPLSRACKSSKKHPIPDGWQPSADDIAWARSVRPEIVDLAAFTKKFVYKVNDRGGASNTSRAWRHWLKTERITAAEGVGDDQDRVASHQVNAAGLGERNRAVASDCLSRILSRRAGRADPRQ